MFTINNLQGQNDITKITDLKLSSVPTTTVNIDTLNYQPYAAIFHKGNELESGHYIAYLKQRNSKWICANDMEVCTQRWPMNSKDVYVIVL